MISTPILTPSANKEPQTCSLDKLLCEGIDVLESSGGLSSVQIHDICTDSRKVHPGSMFIAIAGAKGDGLQFLHEAIGRGVVAIVSDRDIEVPSGVCSVKVPNARDATSRLAARFHGLDQIQQRREMTSVGVTGTNGKTTVAYMVREMLRSADRPTALFGTIEYDLVSRKTESPLTTPDPIELVKHLMEAHKAGARHAVLEVSSHSLDQHRTAGIVFSTAVFTNLTQDHLDYHETMDAYAGAKRRLFTDLAPDATAVVNVDDPAGDAMLSTCNARVIRYGLSPEADLKADDVAPSRSGCAFKLVFRAETVTVQLNLAGMPNVYNALAAAGAGLSLGLSLETIANGLNKLERVPGRLQRIETGELGFDVFVDYAHTDDALRNVLSALRPLTEGKLWCVFGCGGDRDRAKRPKMVQAVAKGADSFIITSDNPRTEDPMAIIADIESGLTPEARIRGYTEPDRETAIDIAISRLKPGDTLLIAGKGHENYQIVGTEKFHFDDVEVADNAVQNRKRD
ncbi:MAG TPA: UDP-N-acetylmuramoyl-L-alanyl-D-glutamate--2,6-diaminopimelate ligase [Phycisphaerae bacterium]|nr:UDP-N-acetylmuramoyl-L-alanyl-D-glutamate--2,6-diaminopimelate ligase [Phycisphaerae bacterium]